MQGLSGSDKEEREKLMAENSESSKYGDQMTHRKLVRDRIPEIIEANDQKHETRILEKDEHLELLKKKLLEESQEVVEATNRDETIKELADVSEVVRSIAESEGIGMDEINEVMEDRAEKRGRFKDGIFLERTWTEK